MVEGDTKPGSGMSQHVVVETILHDKDVLDRLSAGEAVHWMGEAIDAHHRGELVAPPRAYADFGDGLAGIHHRAPTRIMVRVPLL